MLETLFQNPSQQILAKYSSQLRQINEIGKKFKNFTDSELQEKSKNLKDGYDQLRKHILSGEVMNQILKLNK